MGDSFDVVIVGGAVMGCAAAYHLKALGGESLRIAVVERDPRYTTASTTLSAGSIRQQFSTPLNIRLSRFGRAFLDELNHDVPGGPPPIPFTPGSYLFLATPDGLPVLDANLSVQSAEGVPIHRYDAAELAISYPWLNTAGLAGAARALDGEGWFDGHDLLQALRRRCRNLTVSFLHDTVVGLDRNGTRLGPVRLASGRRLAAGQVVNAAGPAAGAVAAMAGVPLPVVARKRCVFHFRAAVDIGLTSLMIDPSGFYVRPHGPAEYLAGMPPDPDPDTAADDFAVPPTFFEDCLWPALAHRVPAFEAVRLLTFWAGHYEYCTLDQNAVVGPPPDLENLFFLNGFSGHGLQHAAGAGRGLAELMLTGRFQSLDLSPLGYERILENRPLRERAII